MIENKWLSRSPVQIRRGIPVFVDKGSEEERSDRYERYWEVVVRQLLLHFADRWGRENGFAPANEFMANALTGLQPANILEVGGGAGRLAGELALLFPASSVFLIDYSYNMLKSALDLWLEGKEIELDGRHLGWSPGALTGRRLTNLWLGQARGEDLPFQDGVMDAVVSSFFLDRAADPERAVREQWRVLRPGGRLVAVSPLNFQDRRHWEKFGDPEKMTALFQRFGLQLLTLEPEIVCREFLDARGNVILWRAAGWVLEKKAPFLLP